MWSPLSTTKQELKHAVPVASGAPADTNDAADEGGGGSGGTGRGGGGTASLPGASEACSMAHLCCPGEEAAVWDRPPRPAVGLLVESCLNLLGR